MGRPTTFRFRLLRARTRLSSSVLPVANHNWLRASAAEVSPVPDGGTWMSPVWLGTGVTPNPEALLGDAFTVGGWHLTPISGPELTRASEIAYFGFIVRPALNEEGAVELESTVQLKRDGQPYGKTPDCPPRPVPDQWRSLHVRQLHRPGGCPPSRTLRIRVHDHRENLQHLVHKGFVDRDH